MKKWLSHLLLPGRKLHPPVLPMQEITRHQEIIQKACSDYLAKIDQKLTLKQRKVGFGIILVLSMAFFIKVLYSGLFSVNTFHSLPHESLITPTDISLPDSLNIPLLKQRRLQSLNKDIAIIL
jgi:hypothetical protein